MDTIAYTAKKYTAHEHDGMKAHMAAAEGTQPAGSLQTS